MTRFLFFSFFLSVTIPASAQQGDIILKADLTRLVNPFNSTIQLGAEYFTSDRVSLQADFGIKSPVYKKLWYNRGVFVSHSQIRKYFRSRMFLGFDLFYLHARKYDASSTKFDKKTEVTLRYDSATLIKNSYGLAFVFGEGLQMGKVILEFYTGVGIRIVNNRVDKPGTTTTAPYITHHYDWGNDNYTGTFPGGHFLLGIKLGYLLKQ